jgi:hypothetical protein
MEAGSWVDHKFTERIYCQAPSWKKQKTEGVAKENWSGFEMLEKGIPRRMGYEIKDFGDMQYW